MNLCNERVKPYEGLESIKLTSNYHEIQQLLKENKVSFKEEIWKNETDSHPVPWKIIHIKNSIHLFFAEEILFKIYLDNNYEGSLSNGIKINTSMEEALRIDGKLEYSDWDEVFVSPEGYWLEDDLETKKVLSMTVFIKEIQNDNIFYSYEWIKNY